MTLYDTPLQCTTLDYTVLQCVTLYANLTLYDNTLHCSSVYDTQLLYILPLDTTLYDRTLHYIGFYCITLHYTVLCTMLHRIKLHDNTCICISKN